MHLDWNWIKQRPHFIAEGLSKYYNIKVVYMAGKQFNNKTKNETELDIHPVYRLPFYENKVVYIFNKIFLRFYITRLIKKYKPDIIWITFPQLYDYIPPNINCKLIYDCMDDAIRFKFTEDFKTKISQLEKKLVENSNLVLVPSNQFLINLKKKYPSCKNFKLVRNAFSGLIEFTNEKKEKKEKFRIGYVGTISKLIDFNIIESTLHEIKNVEFHFIGPNELRDKIVNDRIKFHKPIPYNELYSHVKNCDCLILPFKLIESVIIADPVKLYGYINYNKPIISIYYEELEYFSEFIYFYSNRDNLINLIGNLINTEFNKKYTDSQRIEFLKNNSWDNRVLEILKSIENL